MLDQNVLNKLNEQINYEFYSAHLYLSMSAYFAASNLKGFATWMRVQYEEELQHTLKLFDYINNRGGGVVLAKVAAPKTSWNSPLEAFTDTFAHEQAVTALINGVVDIAETAKDRATCSFLQWFIDEQVEEEANSSEILDKLTLIQDNPYALLMLDKDVGARTLTIDTGTTAP